MASGEELQERLTEFAVRIMDLCDQLPKTFAGRHLSEQLFRFGTASAANYAEARGAESRSDFIHKLGVLRKELNESLVWLCMIERRAMGPGKIVEPLRGECDELAESSRPARKRPKRTTGRKGLVRKFSDQFRFLNSDI